MAKRAILKITGIVALSIFGLALLGFAAFYLRLSFGPVPLNFLTDNIEARINQNLPGMVVRIAGAQVERSAASGLPQLRLQGLVISDQDGNEIASAPKAAIGIDESALFTGIVVPRSLELIGPVISLKRNLEGGMELGFGGRSRRDRSAAACKRRGSPEDYPCRSFWRGCRGWSR